MIKGNKYVIIIIFMSLFSGCLFNPHPGEEMNIVLNPSSFDRTSSSFTMAGEVSISGGTPDKSKYNGVSINLYDSNKELICTRSIGVLSKNDASFSLSTQTPPYYITVESNDFWEEKMSMNYYRFSDDRNAYESYVVGDKSEMPVWNPEQDGPECRSGNTTT